jgi:hypothetical protein
MLTALVLALTAQAQAQPPTPPPDESKFSESFRRYRARQRARQLGTWTDHVAFAVTASGDAHFFLEPAQPAIVASAIAIDLEFGAHLVPSVALVGTAQVRAAFLRPGTEAVIGGLGGGVRLGERHYVTLGAGLATVTLMRVTSTAQTGLAPSLEVRGALVLVGAFGLHLRAGVVFAPSAAVVDVGLGFGFST